jgi:hypothetical protein
MAEPSWIDNVKQVLSGIVFSRNPSRPASRSRTPQGPRNGVPPTVRPRGGTGVNVSSRTPRPSGTSGYNPARPITRPAAPSSPFRLTSINNPFQGAGTALNQGINAVRGVGQNAVRAAQQGVGSLGSSAQTATRTVQQGMGSLGSGAQSAIQNTSNFLNNLSTGASNAARNAATSASNTVRGATTSASNAARGVAASAGNINWGANATGNAVSRGFNPSMAAPGQAGYNALAGGSFRLAPLGAIQLGAGGLLTAGAAAVGLAAPLAALADAATNREKVKLMNQEQETLAGLLNSGFRPGPNGTWLPPERRTQTPSNVRTEGAVSETRVERAPESGESSNRPLNQTVSGSRPFQPPVETSQGRNAGNPAAPGTTSTPGATSVSETGTESGTSAKPESQSTGAGTFSGQVGQTTGFVNQEALSAEQAQQAGAALEASKAYKELAFKTKAPTAFTPQGWSEEFKPSLSDYYQAQETVGSTTFNPSNSQFNQSEFDRVTGELGYNDNLKTWAKANPMLAQREYAKLLERQGPGAQSNSSLVTSSEETASASSNDYPSGPVNAPFTWSSTVPVPTLTPMQTATQGTETGISNQGFNPGIQLNSSAFLTGQNNAAFVPTQPITQELNYSNLPQVSINNAGNMINATGTMTPGSGATPTVGDANIKAVMDSLLSDAKAKEEIGKQAESIVNNQVVLRQP